MTWYKKPQSQRFTYDPELCLSFDLQSYLSKLDFTPIMCGTDGLLISAAASTQLCQSLFTECFAFRALRPNRVGYKRTEWSPVIQTWKCHTGKSSSFFLLLSASLSPPNRRRKWMITCLALSAQVSGSMNSAPERSSGSRMDATISLAVAKEPQYQRTFFVLKRKRKTKKFATVSDKKQRLREKRHKWWSFDFGVSFQWAFAS